MASRSGSASGAGGGEVGTRGARAHAGCVRVGELELPAYDRHTNAVRRQRLRASRACRSRVVLHFLKRSLPAALALGGVQRPGGLSGGAELALVALGLGCVFTFVVATATLVIGIFTIPVLHVELVV